VDSLLSLLTTAINQVRKVSKGSSSGGNAQGVGFARSELWIGALVGGGNHKRARPKGAVFGYSFQRTARSNERVAVEVLNGQLHPANQIPAVGNPFDW
jgi:hypothetical protein